MKEELNYCLNCKIKPCSLKGCPLGNNIPDFIKLAKEEKYKEAYNVLSQTTVLPGICGIICPHTKQCQGSCIRGIKGEPVQIGNIENYIFEQAVKNEYSLKEAINIEQKPQLVNKKVAIVGAGPAGLTCAAFLAKDGVETTIYEKHDNLGGLLSHGIPEFRLPHKLLKQTIDRILDLGIQVKYNKKLGDNLSLTELEQNYDAVFLAIGANKSAKMGIKGENIKGVYGANELLEYNIHPNYTGKIVCVVGGGNVAMDCARTVKKLRGRKSICYI